MFVRTTVALAFTVLITAVACGDDDDTPAQATGGKTAAGGVGGNGGHAALGGQNEGGAAGGGSDLVAHGKYLVDHVIACPDCHTPRDSSGAPIADQYMAGSECLVKLENGDCLNAKNLTNDETGLKNRTDEEIKRMIRDGVRPSATGDEALNPVMPYYVFHNMKDEDLDAVIAYLRTIPGVKKEIPRSAEAFALETPAEPIDPSTIPMPDKTYPEYESAMRGRYLAAESGACMECHTPHNRNSATVLDPEKFFTGGEGFAIPGLPGKPISANLTSDEDTGLGKWTADDVVKVLKQGIDKEGDRLCPPMPVGPMGAYGGLTDQDAKDIANYILSLPPKVNQIDDVCQLPAR